MPSRYSSLARRSLALGLSACLFASGGCSYMFVDGPPKQHTQLPYFTCTTSRGWPVVDTVLGSFFGLEAIVALTAAGAAEEYSYGGPSESDTLAAAGLTLAGLTALFVASAVSGYRDASQCREATEQLQLRLMRAYPGPGFAPTPNGLGPVNDPWVRPLNRPFGTPASSQESGTDDRAPAPSTPKGGR